MANLQLLAGASLSGMITPACSASTYPNSTHPSRSGPSVPKVEGPEALGPFSCLASSNPVRVTFSKLSQSHGILFSSGPLYPLVLPLWPCRHPSFQPPQTVSFSGMEQFLHVLVRFSAAALLRAPSLPDLGPRHGYREKRSKEPCLTSSGSEPCRLFV